ncbi:DUF1326 domain-containing protein [Mycolicibacterium farcinogenes]|nr:DUF1326 domain-containing protein [Mycolicibacterium farcinogenes]
MATRDWHRGHWFDVCGCEPPCPCGLARESAPRHCLSSLVWTIGEGHYGETDFGFSYECKGSAEQVLPARLAAVGLTT